MEFKAEIDEAVHHYEKAIRVPATRTRQMIETHGYVDAVGRLMLTADVQKGFKVLMGSGQMDRTFEAVVKRFPELFNKVAVESADFRIKNWRALKDER